MKKILFLSAALFLLVGSALVACTKESVEPTNVDSASEPRVGAVADRSTCNSVTVVNAKGMKICGLPSGSASCTSCTSSGFEFQFPSNFSSVLTLNTNKFSLSNPTFTAKTFHVKGTNQSCAGFTAVTLAPGQTKLFTLGSIGSCTCMVSEEFCE